MYLSIKQMYKAVQRTRVTYELKFHSGGSRNTYPLQYLANMAKDLGELLSIRIKCQIEKESAYVPLIACNCLERL